jgi:hypothetical protein
LTSNEIRRLLAALALTPTTCLSNAISWSTWRRRHQHQARTATTDAVVTVHHDQELP